MNTRKFATWEEEGLGAGPEQPEDKGQGKAKDQPFQQTYHPHKYGADETLNQTARDPLYHAGHDVVEVR
jgi:hypothetical protein